MNCSRNQIILVLHQTNIAVLVGLGLTLVASGGCNKKSEPQSDSITREELLDSLKGSQTQASAGPPSATAPVAPSPKENSEMGLGDSKTSPISPGLKGTDELNDFLEEAPDANQQSQSILASDAKLADPAKKLLQVEDDPSADWTTNATIPNKTFEINFAGDKPVGFSTRDVQFRPGVNQDSVRTELTTSMRVSVDGVLKNQTTTLITHELPNGSLLRLEGELTIGEIKNQFTGVVEGSNLKIDSNSNGVRTRATIPWNEDFRGPFAIEQSLMRSPLKMDEVRVLRHLDPMLGRVVETSLRGIEVAKSQTMLLGLVELQEISVNQRDGDRQTQSTVWADTNGEILKALHPQIKLRSFRVDEPATIELKRLMALNDLPTLQIPLESLSDEEKQIFKNAPNRQSITFKITSKTSDPFESVSRNSLQSIRSINARSADLTVYRTVSDATEAKGILREESVPTKALDIKHWIDPESKNWGEYLTSLRGERDLSGLSEHDKAILLRDALLKRWQLTPSKRKISNLSNLIGSNKGSSLEQALVLGNACRALKIPTRMAIGYVVAEESDGYVLNLDAWIEVFDSKQWFSIDPQVKSLDASPNRFKVLESYFEDTRLYEEIAQVSNWANDVEVRVVPE